MKSNLAPLLLCALAAACSETQDGNTVSTAPGESPPHESSGTMEVQAGFHDFGEVCIDSGAQVVDQTFYVKNTSDSNLEVVKIATTCGCAKATMTPEHLTPGETGELLMSIEVSGVGVVEQSAILMLSDSRSLRFTQRALGTRTTRLMTIPARMRLESGVGSLAIQLYLVDQRGIPETGPPTVTVGGKPIEINFSGWETIEDFDHAHGRPLRQLGLIELSSSRLGESEISTLNIKTPSGLTSEVMIDLKTPGHRPILPRN